MRTTLLAALFALIPSVALADDDDTRTLDEILDAATSVFDDDGLADGELDEDLDPEREIDGEEALVPVDPSTLDRAARAELRRADRQVRRAERRAERQARKAARRAG